MQYGITEAGDGTASEVLSTSELKAFLRVTHSTEDTLIEAIRQAAINYVEQFCNIRLGDRSATFFFSEFPDFVELPIGPVNSITNVK